MLNIVLLTKSRNYEQKSGETWTPIEQKLCYLEAQTASPASGKEIRLYRMQEMFKSIYRFFLEQRLSWSKKL